MPKFIGKSINLNIQEAFEDAVTQALISKAEEVHGTVKRVELVRVFAERQESTAFRNLSVEIEAS